MAILLVRLGAEPGGRGWHFGRSSPSPLRPSGTGHTRDLEFGTAIDFDWDAVVPNMVYVWTGLAQSLGLHYYAIPGIDIPPETGFQYREPPEDDAFMQPGECEPWRKEKARVGPIPGDEELCRRTWEQIDSLGNTFIWQQLLSF